MQKIIAVFKTHFDYGYTDRKEDILKAYCTTKLEDALNVCEKTQKYGEELEYKWVLPAFLLMEMYHNCSKENQERLVKLIKRNQIVCHALPFTMHTALLDQNMLSNMFVWTDEYCNTFKKPFPIAAKMTDVPGHTSAIIKPLLNRGVKFLHLGKNGASTGPSVPLLFWWEDLEGNRILTMYNKLYGSELNPPKNWKYPVWLAFCHTNDNAGVQSEDYILNIKSQVNKNCDFVTGTLDDFAKEILKCNLNDLPVIKGDLSDTWIHGVGSYPKAVSVYRRSKFDFYEAEKLAAIKKIDISEDRKEFYKNALIFSEHTFGCNVLKYFGENRVYNNNELNKKRAAEENYKFAELTWADESNIAQKISTISNRVINKVGLKSKENTIAEPFDIDTDGKNIFFSLYGRRVKLFYEYRVFGASTITGFLKKYISRFLGLWTLSDFGKLWYPEIPDKNYGAKIKEIQKKGNEYIISFENQKESVNEYGNFSAYSIQLIKTGGEIRIKFTGEKKGATNFAEAGNLCFIMEGQGTKFSVEQAGTEIDVNTDIVKNGNQILWSMDRYAKIDQTVLYSYDAPLISFEKNAIFQPNLGKRTKKKPSFVINLFNNQWGTNFPQWIESKELTFDFLLCKEK